MSRLYMYDVRGIQDYIFRTNKLKEIIGASELVADKVIDVFYSSIGNYKVHPKSKEDVKTLSGSLKFNTKKDAENELDAEVLYYGGGNFYVLFADEKVANEVNKLMRIKLVKETYSLQLAIASVEVTGDYKTDYDLLSKEMDNQKLNMPFTKPVSSFPFTLNDPQSGLPLSKNDSKSNQRISAETALKLEVFNDPKYKDINKGYGNINDFGFSEGDSMVAIVHIDGNNMGQNIINKISGINNYNEAAEEMRKLTKNIDDVFTGKALTSVENKVADFCKIVGFDLENKSIPFRRIINAGDDITFICNARIALLCVKEFIHQINKDGTYTVCGGMYVTHSNFPFSRAYELTEELCSIAKEKSRKNKGNYIDFQVNYSGLLTTIKTMRKRNFSSKGWSYIARPYSVCEGESPNINDLCELLVKLKGVPRGKLKSLRDIYSLGEAYLDKEIEKINSRLEDDNKLEKGNYQLLFDAIDVLDLDWGKGQ